MRLLLTFCTNGRASSWLSVKNGEQELGAGEGDQKSADQRSEVRRMEDLQAALANRYEGGSVQARAANEVQKLKCRSLGQH